MSVTMRKNNPLTLSLSKGEVSISLWFDKLIMSG
jgi:hypothetical protein